jgi:hypothetical protein
MENSSPSHRYFPVGKFRYPASRRRAPALRSSKYSLLTLLLRLRHPNSKKISRVFCQILLLTEAVHFSHFDYKTLKVLRLCPTQAHPKNSFRKTESALVPPPARKLLGQNTKERCPFLFRRNWSRANPKSKEHFSLVSAEALRDGGGTDSFVQFPLEKGSRKVYDFTALRDLKAGTRRRDQENKDAPAGGDYFA